jgi:hypothetical protein
MLISSLEKMEAIVENNDALSWSGWDVNHLQKSATAWMKPEGVFKNGDWFIQKQFVLSANGWEIPNKFVR